MVDAYKIGKNDEVQVEGMQVLLHNLEQMPKKVAKKHNRAIMRASAAPIAKEARANVKRPTKAQSRRLGIRRRSGALAKSIKIKVIGIKNDVVATAIVGPEFKVQVEGAYKPGKMHIPAKIAHLVESGHKGGAKPWEFLRPAWASKLGEAQKIMRTKTWEAIRKESQRPTS